MSKKDKRPALPKIDIGINAKMSELHAAMGLCVLPKVGEIIALRKQCFAWYEERLAGCNLIRPAVPAEIDYNYAYFPVVFPTHEIMARVRQALLEAGVSPRRYFCTQCHVPQKEVKPLVGNDFRTIDQLLQDEVQRAGQTQ